MDSALDIAVHRHEQVVVVHPRGLLKVRTAAELRKVLAKELTGHGRVVVDLDGLRVGRESSVTVFPAVLTQCGGWPSAKLALCRVTGTVDLITAPALASRLIEAVHEGRPHLVIDLSAVAVLNCTGLHAALDILDSYDIDGHLAIVIDSRSEALTRPEINELSEIVDIHHDLASALRTCARASITTGGRHRAIA